jgi:hypothetical protein
MPQADDTAHATGAGAQATAGRHLIVGRAGAPAAIPAAVGREPHMLKLDTAAVLTDLNGEPVIRITATGDAVLCVEGEVVDLMEAREIWVEGGGDEWEFDQAESYVDSIR